MLQSSAHWGLVGLDFVAGGLALSFSHLPCWRGVRSGHRACRFVSCFDSLEIWLRFG